MNFDTPAKQRVAIAFSLVAIGVAAFLIFRQSGKKPEEQLRHHRALGRILAEETAKSVEHREKKRLLVITGRNPDTFLRTQFDSFMKALKQHPEIEIKETVELESEGKHRISAGHGLSARQFVRLVEKNLKADVIVSLVGAPEPDDKDLKALTVKVPRFLAHVGKSDRVAGLIDQKMLRVAIVPRFDYPSPVKEPKTEQEWFDKYFQIIRAPKTTKAPGAGVEAAK